MFSEDSGYYCRRKPCSPGYYKALPVFSPSVFLPADNKDEVFISFPDVFIQFLVLEKLINFFLKIIKIKYILSVGS